MAPRETENNAYAKFWVDKQRTLWYVMVFLEWSINFRDSATKHHTVPSPPINRDLTKLRRRRQGERQKNNRFNEQNNNSARASRFFVHLFSVPVQVRREMTEC